MQCGLGSRFRHRFIHQQDGDAVPYGISTPAGAALQRVFLRCDDQGLLALRADQMFKADACHSRRILTQLRPAAASGGKRIAELPDRSSRGTCRLPRQSGNRLPASKFPIYPGRHSRRRLM